MDISGPVPRYALGDFVRCVHVYYNYHYYYGYHNEDHEPHNYYYGIIVDIDYASWGNYEIEHETLYIVHCTDGVRRFFTEDEVYKLS